MLTSHEIRKKFLNFFEERGHTVVPSSSLMANDPSVLLTTAGMQQFKPYFMGGSDPKKDFNSLNTASIQKSFRTSDIDEVGDESHLTFFEMLGNFSFGGYFKEEAIGYAYDFFRENNLPIHFVTVFSGDLEVARDEESAKIWRNLGFSEEKGNLRYMGRKDNFWGPTGSEGPCGPTTEIYVDGVEIWNLVFNEYYCKPSKPLTALKKKGVDTGMGLERLARAVQKKNNIFETDLFSPLLELLPPEITTRHKRIIIDHLRGSIFLLADRVRPSNKEAGYILRRILRRAFVYENFYKIQAHVIDAILHDIIHEYGEFYSELMAGSAAIREEFDKERGKFFKTMKKGVKELSVLKNKGGIIDGKIAFDLYQTFGLPYEVIKEFGGSSADILTRESFDEEFKKHQEISRAGLERKFGGHGLLLDTGELKAADQKELEVVTRLHTVTHLLNAALHKVLGDQIKQQGSDITVERTRFDFTFSRKLTREELQKIEDLVNSVISQDLKVEFQEMPYEEAAKTNPLRFWKEKYPAQVKVYTIYDPKTGEVFSRELCGGPHVNHTGEIGHFKIIKEESSSAGVRRIRGIIEKQN